MTNTITLEFPDSVKNPSWIHFSYNRGKNRRQILIATKENGKTVYLPYKGNESLIAKQK